MSETDARPTRARGTLPPSGDQSVDAAQGDQLANNFGKLLPSGVDQDSNDAFGELPTYSTSHRFRGQALIFNNGTFKHMANRPGTERDVVHLRTCLTKLGFDVRTRNDATHEEIKQRIAKAASEDHEDADCFLCVFLSHGDDGVIYGKDSKANRESTAVRLQEDVFDKFRGENCATLVGKPKIFIIQACRGMDYEEGVIEADSAGDSVDSHTIGSDIEEEGGKPTVPSGADFIICYSTSQGFFSFRNNEDGSWYITELCKQLNGFGQEEEMNTILTRVHNKVSLRSSKSKNLEACGKKQMPCYISMLTKQLVFKPKAKKGYYNILLTQVATLGCDLAICQF